MSETCDVALTGIQYDRLVAQIEPLPPGVAEPVARIVDPSRRSTAISDIVLLTVTIDEAVEVCESIHRWLVENPPPLHPAEERRRTRNLCSSLVGAAYRMTSAARLPRMVSLRRAEAETVDASPGVRRSIARTMFLATDEVDALAWVERHRAVVRALEVHPLARGLRQRSLAHGLPTVKGTFRVAVPEWWTIVAPTARWAFLPAPGSDPYTAAHRWYTEAATTARVAALAERSEGPARLAVLWSWTFLAGCTGGWGTTSTALDREATDAVRDAFYDVVSAGDPFDGAPVSPIDLYDDPVFRTDRLVVPKGHKRRQTEPENHP